MGTERASRLWQPHFIQCPDLLFCLNCAFLLLKPICMCAGGTSAPEASAEVQEPQSWFVLTKPFQSTSMVKTHLRTNRTTPKRKALEKRTQLINSHLLINIDLQQRLIKRCLISIFRQFCFVAGGSAAVPHPGQERDLPGIPGTMEIPGQPHLTPPTGGSFPLGDSKMTALI